MESDFINTIVWILLILLPEALGQQWSFSFPQSIQALKGSCVEIPCSYTRPRTLRPPKVTWYLEGRKDYYTVFDSHDRGEALDTYRSRTKLVLNTINSCTLHISNVRSDDEGSYIPEVDNRDAYDLNGATVRITVIAVAHFHLHRFLQSHYSQLLVFSSSAESRRAFWEMLKLSHWVTMEELDCLTNWSQEPMIVAVYTDYLGVSLALRNNMAMSGLGKNGVICGTLPTSSCKPLTSSHDVII
eukprot:XP_017945129.1 PREDICTED: sialoadhesin-like [Xenopus tropicalis]